MTQQYFRRPNGDLIPVIEIPCGDVQPSKSKARREVSFVAVPLPWMKHLDGATGQTCRLAMLLLDLAFRRKSRSISLANTTAASAGIPRHTKWRALRDLERRELVIVEARPRKPPMVHLLQMKMQP